MGNSDENGVNGITIVLTNPSLCLKMVLSVIGHEIPVMPLLFQDIYATPQGSSIQ